ncbi:general odorant-binding protein 71-like [Anopheles albimanus]|uniref:Odorant-binding protein 29 n=1 Tax=Anopheles albimanus TaxID=7167 RepID=A0A182FW65_ANOAL|nr:general odorant-binding protein 71-like [Anopheles albimanus]
MQYHKVTPVGVLVVLLAVLGCTEALRCRTDDGPSTEEVKQIVRTCLSKLSNAQTENRSSENEYPDYDSSYKDSSEERTGSGSSRNRGSTKPNYDGRREGSDRGRGSNRGQQQQQDSRSMNDRYNDHRYDRQYQEQDYGRNQGGRQRRQYPPYPAYGQNAPFESGGGVEWSRSRGNTMMMGQGNGPGNGSHNGTSLDLDRACLMQCFFEQLKATDANGLPERHKVLHVITRDIRDRELRDFYVDSIQECFHMLGLDPRLKDKCDYAMRLVTCLTDRFQSNCSDWDMDSTSAMF